jgi:hypothetical protein
MCYLQILLFPATNLLKTVFLARNSRVDLGLNYISVRTVYSPPWPRLWIPLEWFFTNPGSVLRIRDVSYQIGIRPFSHLRSLIIRIFYPGSGSDHIPIPDPWSGSSSKQFFSPGSYMKSGMQIFSCYLFFQEQSLSVSHSQKDPGSGKNSYPGSRSATLLRIRMAE